MKISFKDVGQGDSIILEWSDNGEEKIGIIDCRKYDKNNPVVSHLEKLGWKNKAIDFIIVSHPHYDHFSGMVELLTYCKNNKIKIKVFGFSFTVDQRYLKGANPTKDTASKLNLLLRKIQEIKNSGYILEKESINRRWSYTISEKYTLQSISPSQDEIDRYIKEAEPLYARKDYRKASKAANIFSTTLILKADKEYVLLTSDTTLEAFDRIIHQNMGFFNNRKLVLAQIPHHGSKKNHKMFFWKNLDYEINTPVVISAGAHERYRHPSIGVLQDFDKNDFKVYSTNHVNGMDDFLKEKKELHASDSLNMLNINDVIKNNHGIEGNQVFHLKKGSALYVY